jgi:hypothetical protein
MRVFWVFMWTASAACGTSCLWAQQPEPAQKLVREVVYNELHDHDTHGYWRYWIEKRAQNATRLEDQVETADGPIARLVRANGLPLDTHSREDEQTRLRQLVNSPGERANHRRAYSEDEKRIGAIFAQLPDAFLFESLGEDDGCRHLRFRPNPNFQAHTIQSRIFHAMSGELWLDTSVKRLQRLEGRLDADLNFGFGLLGHVDKGSWFQMQRLQVSATEWKTEQLEIHISGRAMLFNTISHDTSELRGGFSSVPAGLDLAGGMRLLEQTGPKAPPNSVAARMSPALFKARR